MIFLTLGTQLPFDRLVEALDSIAPQLREPVFGQIGNGRYKPTNFEWVPTLSPSDFQKHFQKARVVVGHAGIGTVLEGFKAEKPLVLMARRASLNEHRNDHQIATIEQMQKFTGVYVAENSNDLLLHLVRSDLEGMQNQISPARRNLIEGLKNIISKT